jgi:hypothetical protein
VPYTFTLNSFKITDTRAPHHDTDFVSLAVAVGNNPPSTVPTKSMGNLNNGTYQVMLSIPNIEVPAGETVAFSYSIVNTGHDKDTVSQALQKVVTAGASKAAERGAAVLGTAVGGPLGGVLAVVGTKAGTWLAGKIGAIVFANCDGTVAAADHVYNGARLAQLTTNGQIISVTDDCHGTDSDWGCGGNSHYYVTWSISAQPQQPDLVRPVIGIGHIFGH